MRGCGRSPLAVTVAARRSSLLWRPEELVALDAGERHINGAQRDSIHVPRLSLSDQAARPASTGASSAHASSMPPSSPSSEPRCASSLPTYAVTQPVKPTPRAPEPGEAPTERATAQTVTKLLLHKTREALPVAEVSRLRQEHLEVIAHHLMPNARCGLRRFVRRRRRGHAWPSAESVPRRRPRKPGAV